MLSIIIPTLNEEKYIGKLLNSLKRQSFKDFEVLIVDGNSKDNTIKVAKNKDFKSLKLSVIKTKGPNVAMQRNVGAQGSKGNKLLFVDADCIMDKRFLEKMLEEARKKDIRLGGSKILPIENSFVYTTYYSIFNLYLKLMRIFRPYLNTACLLADKKIHDKISGFNEKIVFGEDYEYSSRAAEHVKSHMFKSVAIKTSTRRFQRYGLVKTTLKFIFAGILLVFVKGFKKNIIDYKFGGFSKDR